MNLKSFRFYDRMLPCSNEHRGWGTGLLIALHYRDRRLKNGNSAFVDGVGNLCRSMGALFATQRLSAETIDDCIKKWNVAESSQDSFLPEETKPWERTRKFHKEDVDGQLRLTLANRIYIETANLKPRLQNKIRRMAAIQNPMFYRNQALGLSNFSNSRFLYLGEDDGDFLCIPRGLWDELLERCKEAEIPIQTEDKRAVGKTLNVHFQGELRDNQKEAVRAILQWDCGILSAATAFGKTVVCSRLIAERKVSTLILLESSALIEQWQKALERFLEFQEELPVYETKTGRKKHRMSVVGIIHGPKDTSTGIVDIAMAGSLCKKGEFHPRLREYGLVLEMDECHPVLSRKHCVPYCRKFTPVMSMV